MQNRRLQQLILKATLIVLSGFGWGNFRAVAQAPQMPRQFPVGSLGGTGDLPAGRVRERLEKLPVEKRKRALGWLRSFHFTEQDLQSLEIDSEGGVFYVDPAADLPAVQATEPVTAAASVPMSPFPASLIFHSKPGAPNVIYIDFDGETVTGTQWNTDLGRTEIVAQAFSTDSDFTTFSDAEQVAIKRVWQRMAEDYAPFNVDVTTERPATFGARVAHALITRNTQADGQLNPASTAGGVAYVNVFGSSTYAKYRPAWIYYNNLANDASYTAEAASHEIGHNLGLSHDGTTTSDYYGGHGSGETSWGPIMGTGYNRSVSQWSKGEYLNANNTQDDLAIIAGKLTYLTDDHGNTAGTATALVLTGTNIFSTNLENDPTKTNTVNKGVIERNTDIDVFSFVTGAGPVRLQVDPWITPSGTRGNNLDVRVDLYSETGVLLLTVDPAAGTGAVVQTNLAQGIYYLWVRNSATGTPLANPPSGYTSYGSIGQYFISGYVTPSSNFVVAPTADVALTNVADVGVGAATFVVTYADNVGVDVSTINGNDVLVTGPNGYSKLATFVSVDVNSNGTPRKVTYSVAPPNGVAWLQADNGTYHVTMRPQEVADVEGAFVAEHELGTFTVTVPVALYTANMTSNPGWTFDTQWAYGAPSKGGVGGPTSGFTGGNVVAYNLSGAYGNNINPQRYATTPAFSTAGSSTVTLKFQRWLRLARRDSASIEVSTNGVDWIVVWNTGNPVNDSSWREVFYTLPASVAGKPSVRVRWGLGSNNSQNDAGWSIDDVQVLGDGALDATAPTALLSVANLTVAGAPSLACTVTYTDATAVQLASLDSQDILVTGPNGYSNVVEFVGADLPTDGAAITASYSIPAPSGAWAIADNGDYEVTLIEDQVDDVLNNFAPRAVLGTFKIQIPAVVAEFQLNLGVNNSEWGTAQRSPGLLTLGAVVELTATPNQYYRFVEWTGAVTGSENPTTLVMDGNKSVTANFAEILTLSHPTPLWWLAQAGVTNDFETAVNDVGANGLPLWESFVAGLNPTNSESQLKLTAGAASGGLSLNWNTSTDRLYTIEFSESLDGPFVALPNATDLPATTQNLSLQVSGGVNGFYRIVVRKP